MILDICFYASPPEQVQRIRMFTVYMSSDAGMDLAEPEIVVHFYHGPQRNIPLSSIKTLMVTND